LLAKIESASGRLLEFPLSGSSRERFAPGLYVIFEGNYGVYYTASETELVLIRVLHSARDAAAIAERGGFAGREPTAEQEAEIQAVVDEVRKNFRQSKPER
jgi:toxin ParE1/3/4